ncbi:hypothetical protein SERLADRAFT_411911 [Serpula lacrymans var. lacrymans S7.9]|nr:uncharacterized protein SERLADRAFT_411911 [Serpula lacrymans var. lacrymans S7.9]EGO18992.1 hypothetical protein SERLADRAFT_411911 [Serpula lacrymans var. lacrymans S7.9]
MRDLKRRLQRGGWDTLDDITMVSPSGLYVFTGIPVWSILEIFEAGAKGLRQFHEEKKEQIDEYQCLLREGRNRNLVKESQTACKSEGFPSSSKFGVRLLGDVQHNLTWIAGINEYARTLLGNHLTSRLKLRGLFQVGLQFAELKGKACLYCRTLLASESSHFADFPARYYKMFPSSSRCTTRQKSSSTPTSPSSSSFSSSPFGDDTQHVATYMTMDLKMTLQHKLDIRRAERKILRTHEYLAKLRLHRLLLLSALLKQEALQAASGATTTEAQIAEIRTAMDEAGINASDVKPVNISDITSIFEAADEELFGEGAGIVLTRMELEDMKRDSDWINSGQYA